MGQSFKLTVQVPRQYESLLKERTGEYNGIPGRAIFDPYEEKRYFLEKRWGEGDNILLAFMMNPNKASHSYSDDTVDHLIRKSKTLNFDGLFVVNVSPVKKGSSKDLRMADFEFDKINWYFIKEAIQLCPLVFIGWGMTGQRGIKKQLKEKPLLAELINNHTLKMCYYDLITSTDKDKNAPRYYVPHPRPIPEQNKYENTGFTPLNPADFNKLFVYK